MSKLTIALTLLMVNVLFFVLVGITHNVLATGCEIVEQCYFDPDLNAEKCIWYDGCGGNWDYCPQNYYRAPNGSCYENGTEGCECGVKADGSCKACGGGSCNSDYLVSCSGTKTSEVAGTTCVAIVPACKDSSGQVSVGSAQSLGGCCNEKTNQDGDVFCAGISVNTYTCCGDGTVPSCGNVTSTYQGYGCPTYGSPCGSNTFLSWAGSTGTRCAWDTNEDGSPNRNNPIYYAYANCEKTEWKCSCVAACSAPTAPTLASPADGAQLPSTTAGLQWNATTFSSGCTGSYKVYVGTSNPPTTLYSTEASTVLSKNYTGTRGQTYYWYVRAENGGVGASSTIRSFTILDNQITGQVFYDTNNNCGGSGWSSGGGRSLNIRTYSTFYLSSFAIQL